MSGGPGLVVAYGSYERKTWEEKRVVFILDIARGEEAKGEQWETGRRVMRRIAAANREWADEYHLVARAVTKHATKLYEKIGFKRDILGGAEREYQPRPEWLEEYWTVKATVLETELQGEMMEGGRWPRTYALEGGLEKGSKEWKGVQKIHERTHKSDRGGDGTLWGDHEKEKPHVVVWKEAEDTTGREEVHEVGDPAFHEEEEDDPEEGGTAATALTEEQQERAKRNRDMAIRRREERIAERETEQEANDRAYEEAYEEEMDWTEGGDEQAQAAEREEAERAGPQGHEGTDAETGETGEGVEGGGKNMRLRAVLMNVNGRVQTVRRTDGGGGGRGKHLGEGGDLRTEASLGANQVAGCMREGGNSMMVLTDIRLDRAGVKRFTKMMEGKGPYGVVGETSIRGTGGGQSGGVMVVYRTDHLYVGKGAHYTLIPGRALVVKFEVLADESEFDLAAIYMPCRGTTGAGAVWERLADWVTARRGLVMAGDMNASLAKADDRRTPSDRALRELVEEGDVVQIGGGETTYGRADTELDYWLASPDMVTRWVGRGTVEGVSDHRAVEAEYITEMESGGYGRKGLGRLKLERANQEEWDKYEETVLEEVTRELATRELVRGNKDADTGDVWADILEGIQAGTVTAITKVMEWDDRDSEAVVKVKQRLSREGKRKARADVEWWEMMMIETCRPRKFRRRFGGRVRAFEAVDWGAEGVEKELMRICREKLVVLKGVLVRLSGEERKGDDLLETMRAATSGGGGGMMREIFGVLRSGDPGGVAAAPLERGICSG